MFPQHRTSERESGMRERINDCRRRLRRVRMSRAVAGSSEDERRAFGMEEILSQTSDCGFPDSFEDELEALELQPR